MPLQLDVVKISPGHLSVKMSLKKPKLPCPPTLCFIILDRMSRPALQLMHRILQLGAQLEQLQKGCWVPLAFFSRKLSATEKKYSAFDRELLSAYQAVKHFRHYIEAKPFTLYTGP